MTLILVIVIGYLLGSIPTGVLIVRKINPEIDLRKTGSGNIGATNVGRAVGTKWGVAAMLGDCLKGLLPVLFARWIGASPTATALAGMAAFIGHIYPLCLGFEGGKGVATAFGVFLGLTPVAAGLVLLIWVGASLISRTTTLGALSGAIALPILVTGTGVGALKTPAITTSFLFSLMVFYTHRENIRKIIQGKAQPGVK